MARIRTIKPEFFTSLTIGRLSAQVRLTFVGLWTYCDDEGRGVDDPRLIKAAIWPLDESVKPRGLEEWLTNLAAAGLIQRYEADGRRYLAVVGWKEHQRIDHPRPSIFPEPSPNGTGALAQNAGSLAEDSRLERKGKEGKGRERNSKGATQGRADSGNLVTEDHIYLLGRLQDDNPAWKSVTPGAVQKLAARYGFEAVTTALRDMRQELPPGVKRPYPYLESVCVRIAEGG